MLPWIAALLAVCCASAALGFGQVVPLPELSANLCLAVLAVSATLLIGSFDAYESQAPAIDRDDR